MKIAMFTNNYKPFVGGVPISIERLSQDLRTLGHEVYIFAPTYDNQVEEKYTVRYKSLKKKVTDGIVFPNIFDSNIEKEFALRDFDVIHVHHPMLIGSIALKLGKKYNVPVVYTYHTRYEEYLHFLAPFKKIEEKEDKGILSNTILSYSKETIVPKMVKGFVNKCDLVFAPTNTMKEILKGVGARCEIEVLPTGLGENHFNECTNKGKEIRNKYISGKSTLLCTVARLSKEKNLNFLIDGILQVKKKIGDDFKLIVIGDGPMKNELEEKIKCLGLKDNITLIGKVNNNEIKSYYSACDLFVFSSKSETQGIVLLEAMASNLPVVAIEATGVCDVVINNVNGYMVNENINEFSNSICKVINNHTLRERLKLSAKETALKYRGVEIAKEAANLYNKAILRREHKEFNYGYNVG